MSISDGPGFTTANLEGKCVTQRLNALGSLPIN
jgi:hypothetical protein